MRNLKMKAEIDQFLQKWEIMGLIEKNHRLILKKKAKRN